MKNAELRAGVGIRAARPDLKWARSSPILMENLEKSRLARKTEPDPDCSDSLEPDPENRALGGPARMPTPGLELFQTKKKKYYRGVIASFSGVLTIWFKLAAPELINSGDSYKFDMIVIYFG